MTIKCIITDDEPIARKGLARYVERIDYLELVDTCEDAIQLGQRLQEVTVDLLFLDINMPDLSGIDFLKMHKQLPRVILTTAYPEHAIDGYRFDVLDYLLKPIAFDRFYEASEKARQYLEHNRSDTTAEFFFLKCDKRIEKIVTQEILFVESMQNYVRIHTTTNQLLAHLPLKNVKAYLPDEQFLQPHKSYLVAVDKIEAIEGNQLIVGSHKVPISKYQRKAILDRILGDDLLDRSKN